MRSALDTSQFAQRHQQVVGAVARCQITPQQVEDALAETADWSAVSRDVAAAISTFAQSLAQHALLPHEYASEVSDESVATVRPISERHHADAESLAALFSKLAQPDVTTGARRRALTRLNLSDANHTLGSTATAWFSMLESVSSATLRTMNPALLAVLRSTQPTGYDRNVIELAGPIASHATTQLEIENTLERSASLRCTCHEIRRADGIGPAFTPAITVTPAHQMLDAGAEGGVAISLWLDGAQFDAHATYVGAFSVESDGGTTLKIPLRVTTAPARA
jgi:hypothetical protein